MAMCQARATAMCRPRGTATCRARSRRSHLTGHAPTRALPDGTSPEAAPGSKDKAIARMHASIQGHKNNLGGATQSVHTGPTKHPYRVTHSVHTGHT
eukprot:350811-Chlamydomonas_euryale.AAC.5